MEISLAVPNVLTQLMPGFPQEKQKRVHTKLKYEYSQQEYSHKNKKWKQPICLPTHK